MSDDATQTSTGSRFIRRLIPTVAAASLSFTGCLPPGGGNNGNNGNNGDSDGGFSDVGGQDSSERDSGREIEDDLVYTNGDGRAQTLEVQELCRAWSECDSAYFQETFGTVTECTSEFEQQVDYYTSYYEDQYGTECAEVFGAFIECQLAEAACVDGVFYPGYGEVCYVDFNYYEVCGGG